MSRKSRLGLLAAMAVLAACVPVLYVTVPKGNEDAGPVDALLVLGTPAGLHGELTQMQRWRVQEAVLEFDRGRAPRIVFAGGPTANIYVESDVMGRYAEALGVPATAIFRERRSHTTLENIGNAAALLRARGWRTVEVISTAEHLRRAAVLLETTGLRWRLHAAPTPGRGRLDAASATVEEAIATATLRVFGTRSEPVIHALAWAQGRVAFGVRWVVYRLEAAAGRG